MRSLTKPFKLMVTIWLLSLAAYSQPSKEIKIASYVTDHAQVFSPKQKQALEDTLRQFQQTTTQQIVMLTVPSMGEENIEDFANNVFSANKLGQKDKDNGVLVVFAQADRKVRIEVGYGLEGALPDAACYRIINHVMIPAFKEGNYTTGLLNGIRAIVDLTSKEQAYTDKTTIKGEVAEEDAGMLGYILIGVFGLTFFIVGYLLTRRCVAIRTSFIKNLYLGHYSWHAFLDYFIGDFMNLLIGIVFMCIPALIIILPMKDHLDLSFQDIFLSLGGILAALALIKLFLIPYIQVKLFLKKPIAFTWAETKGDDEFYKKQRGSGGLSFGSSSFDSGSSFGSSSSSSGGSFGGGGSSGGGGASGSW